MLVWEILILLLLILLNGFFAMAELAVISARRPRLQAMADAGSRRAAAALALIDDSSRFLSSVQIGITLVGIVAGAFGGATLAVRLAAVIAPLPAVGEFAPEIAFTAVVAAITYLSLIIGELIPKQLALRHAERLALWVARPMTWIARAASPAVHLLDLSTRLGLRLFGRGESSDKRVTEEEIRMLVAEATNAGVVERAEKEMIAGVMRLGELPVEAIMTPRPDIEWLDLDDDLETNLRRLRESPHSRFPVATGDLDELAGMLLAKDLLDVQLRGRPVDLRASVREAEIVPQGVDALQLIDLLKRSPIHMALVVDEYGTIQGLITATDLLEAIVGSLAEVRAGEAEVTVREDGSWLIDGSLPNERLKELLGLVTLPDEGDYHTLAGFVLSRMAHVPEAGEHTEWGGYRFEVMDMDGHRIDKVLVHKLPPPPAPG